jgi:hypothetical protein
VNFSLSQEEKIRAIEFSIKEFEKHLINRLTAAGIDFDDFNIDTFQPREGSSLDSYILETVEKINFLKEKKAALQKQ